MKQSLLDASPSVKNCSHQVRPRAELVKLRTTWCGAIIVVAEIGEKAAEPRSGSVIFEKVATFGLRLYII